MLRRPVESALGNPVNGQEHVELALGQAQLGNLDIHIADVGRRKLPLPMASISLAGSREMPCLSKQRCRLERLSFGTLSRKQPITSFKGKSVLLLNSTIAASSAGERTVLLGFAGPMGASAVVVRLSQ